MIRLGIFTGLENAQIVAEAGFDYIETALNAVAAMSRDEFDLAREALARTGLPCEAVNCMLPGTMPVTGPNVDMEQVLSYLLTAFDRARALGTSLVVFGSGASRGVQEGASHWLSWQQLREFLLLAGPLAGKYGLKIAIEPLCREECNIVNFVSEALALAALLDLPQVGVLGDTYHMSLNGEPLEVLGRADNRLWHLHIACPQGRAFPRDGDSAWQRGEYQQLFDVLRESGYNGRVSVEGTARDFREDAFASFELLDKLRRTANM